MNLFSEDRNKLGASNVRKLFECARRNAAVLILLGGACSLAACFSGVPTSAQAIQPAETLESEGAIEQVLDLAASPNLAAENLFKSQIAPLFEKSCVSCHGPKKQEAGFRLDTYENMMKAGDSGIVFVEPGNPDGSMLIDLVLGLDPFIEQMPSEGKKLDEREVQLLKDWIEQGANGPYPSQRTVDFASHIDPILKANCASCHSGNNAESGLNITKRISLLKGGDSGQPALVPGDADKSALFHRITSEDTSFRMPKGADALPASSIDLLTTWIAEGAYWPGQMDAVEEEATTDLWSMQPIVRPALPKLSKADPIDAFIYARLKDKGISPVGASDPLTLARRASLVLTGLPPKPERVNAFVEHWTQDSDAAYSKFLDELFASKHFGERWGQHWLDIIRWAESNGSEGNEYRKNAWQYRDYVIDAFNSNKPYDEFLKEQLAGDVLGVDIATSFLVAGPNVPDKTVGQEASAIRQARFDRLDEIVQTVASGIMGMTISCARCHSHKFDPISIKDYYSMVALFQDVEYDHRLPILPATDAKMQAEKKYDAEIAEVRKYLASDVPSWREDWTDHAKIHIKPVITDRVRVSFPNANKKNRFGFDEMAFFNSPSSQENITLTNQPKVSSSQIEPPSGRPPSNLVNDIYTDMNGWYHRKGESPGDPWLLFEFDEAIDFARFELSKDRWAVYGTDYLIADNLGPPQMPLAIEVKTQSGDWVEVYRSDSSSNTSSVQSRIGEIKSLSQKREEQGRQMLYAGKLIQPAVTHVLYRGSPETPRDEVAPKGFDILKADFGLDSSATGPERRMAMANWLVDRENPLTARIMVNRFWQQIFGQGLVSTPGDFGFAGAAPSHPELLDWLAAEFVDQDWSMKTMLRMMVESDAFKRSSLPQPHAFKEDASNIYLWRFAPRWAEGEILRDGMLSAAGILDSQLGGPSFRIHADKRRYDQWKVVDNWSEKTWRRSVYQQRIRRVDDRLFSAFDLPGHGQMTHKRSRSTTPLQAFNLLNSDFTLTVSKELVERVQREVEGDKTQQVARMYLLVLGREAEPEEVVKLLELADGEDLSLIARLLFNLNEFRYIH